MPTDAPAPNAALLATPERLAWFQRVSLSRGSHASPEDGVCATEAAAYIAGEPHSDHPACVSPVVAAFLRSWNDALPDGDRDRLIKPLVLRAIGSASTPEVEHRRSLMALDWLIRTHTVAWLRLVERLRPHADALAALPPIDDHNAEAAVVIVRAAGDAAWAATGDAAWPATGAAAGDAAWPAAVDAARAAAVDAARAAAGDAAWAAAWAAAGAAAVDAARDALRATVTDLQAGAASLVEAMIEVQP